MKNKKIIVLLIIASIILIEIFYSTISKNGNIIIEKQLIKEMTETEYESQITKLNKSHEDYATYIQTCKTAIATALTEEGVTTSNQETLETMADNISKIFTEKTKLDSTIAATKNDIIEGKQAYVNGELITGVKLDNEKEYEYTTDGSILIEKDGYFFATVVDYGWNYTSDVSMNNSRTGTISHIGRYTGEVYDKNSNLQQWTTYTFMGEVKAGDTISINGCWYNNFTRIFYPI